MRSRWGSKAREFGQQFYNLDYQRLRQDFAWGLEAAYRKYNKDATKNTLRNFLDNVEFPQDFPPQNMPVGDYADAIRWPNAAGEALWEFYKRLFDGMLEKENKHGLLPPDQYAKFLEARRVTSQFWDSWARWIIEGELSYDAIARPVDANQRAIRGDAIAELAVGAVYHWDKGAGKTPLFRLAKEGPKLGQDVWFKRLRARLGAMLIRTGQGIIPPR
jgi:hypothetical protein